VPKYIVNCVLAAYRELEHNKLTVGTNPIKKVLLMMCIICMYCVVSCVYEMFLLYYYANNFHILLSGDRQ